MVMNAAMFTRAATAAVATVTRQLRPLSSKAWKGQQASSRTVAATLQHPQPITRALLYGSTALLSVGAAFTAFTALSGSTEEVECATNATQYLCKAAQKSNVSDLTRLIQNGGDVNDRHDGGWTPLLVAAANANFQGCELLLKHGADVNIQDEYTPLEKLQYIRIRQQDFSYDLHPGMSFVGMTPLHYAALVNSEKLVNLFIEHGADPNIKDETGSEAVHYTTDRHIRSVLEEYMVSYRAVSASDQEEKARRRRLEYPLEDRLHKHIVGQDGPIMAVSAAVRRRENGWHSEDHPIVFLFLGSSGVGKTELAKRLAQYVHGTGDDDDDLLSSSVNKGFIRLDMTEYQEKHEAAKLIGSPPGYIGHDEGGQLTKMLKKCPNAVVLLDEVEKAHSDVLTVMLQLFDEGRLTDGLGETIECKDAIFIMTSNLAASVIAEHAYELRERAEEVQLGDQPFTLSEEFKENIIRPILKNHFKRDEFLGRINEILYFVPFSRSELGLLVDLEMKKWQERASQRHSITLTWTNDVIDLICKRFDIHYGARSLQHAVDKLIINRIAAAHEQGKVEKGGRIHVFAKNGVVDFVFHGAPDGGDGSGNSGGGLSSWLFGGGKSNTSNHTKQEKKAPPKEGSENRTGSNN